MTASNAGLNWITNFIWGIADDVLRDVYVRGKYRDVILPMTVIRRLDAVLEPTKQAVLSMKDRLDKAGVANQHAALCQVAGEAFYNTVRRRIRIRRGDARANERPGAALKAVGDTGITGQGICRMLRRMSSARTQHLRRLST